MSVKILIIDDHQRLANVLYRWALSQGYDAAVAYDAESGLILAQQESPDLILLDVVLPGMDGLEACRRLRMTSAVPIIVISGYDAGIASVVSLRDGADFFLEKPFQLEELGARVHAVIRRANSSPGLAQQQIVYEGNGITIDLARRMIIRKGHRVPLSSREHQLLGLLYRKRGWIVPHEELAEAIWSGRGAAEIQSLRDCIRSLRLKIEPSPRRPSVIVTRRGVGYYFHGADDPEPLTLPAQPIPTTPRK